MKLETLAERPATKEDIGVKCYEVIVTELILDGVYDNPDTMSCGSPRFKGNQPINFCHNERIYRQKPIIISEQEYLSLQQENKKLRELLDEATKIIKAYECFCQDRMNKGTSICKGCTEERHCICDPFIEQFLKQYNEVKNE